MTHKRPGRFAKIVRKQRLADRERSGAIHCLLNNLVSCRCGNCFAWRMDVGRGQGCERIPAPAVLGGESWEWSLIRRAVRQTGGATYALGSGDPWFR